MIRFLACVNKRKLLRIRRSSSTSPGTTAAALSSDVHPPKCTRHYLAHAQPRTLQNRFTLHRLSLLLPNTTSVRFSLINQQREFLSPSLRQKDTKGLFGNTKGFQSPAPPRVKSGQDEALNLPPTWALLLEKTLAVNAREGFPIGGSTTAHKKLLLIPTPTKQGQISPTHTPVRKYLPSLSHLLDCFESVQKVFFSYAPKPSKCSRTHHSV